MENILQDFSAGAVSQALDANTISFWRLLGQLPRVDFHEGPEILWFETGMRHDVFNGVVQARLRSDNHGAIDHVIDHFQQRHMPFLWYMGPSSSPSTLGSLLQDRGLVHYTTEPGMGVDLLRFNEDIPVTMQLTIEPVVTEEQLRQWLGIWEFGNTEEVIHQWLLFHTGLRLDQQGPLQRYLGRVNEQPIATSSVFFGEGVAGIWYVSTLPHFRRQGIGAAMTLVAMKEARKRGYRVGVLTASPIGYKIYRRIGFQPYCTYSTYLWHPH